MCWTAPSGAVFLIQERMLPYSIDMFAGYWFFCFALVLYPMYWLLPTKGGRQAVIFLFSCVFYIHNSQNLLGLGEVFLLAGLTFSCIYFGSRSLILSVIILNAAFWMCFKFEGEVTEIFCRMWEIHRCHLNEGDGRSAWLVPPLGISFFVFEFVHVLVDVYRKKIGNIGFKSFLIYALFFPTVACGPIKRYTPFARQVDAVMEPGGHRLVMPGFLRVMMGFLKKLVFVDLFGGYIDQQQNNFQSLPIYFRWVVLILIGVRFFLDFSAYSDIAVGFSKMFGIAVPENFRRPYLAIGLQDFWRRWHMSLSTWIRDYVYAYLRGRKGGAARKYFAIILSFVLCGFWHGAEMNFIIWGIYNGVGVLLSSILQQQLGSRFFVRHPFVILLRWVFTQIFVCIGAVVFIYPLQQSTSMINLLFGINA